MAGNERLPIGKVPQINEAEHKKEMERVEKTAGDALASSMTHGSALPPRGTVAPKGEYDVVEIRAMITLDPPPRVGPFNFTDYYKHFRQGVIYKVPRCVANHLVEGKHAFFINQQGLNVNTENAVLSQELPSAEDAAVLEEQKRQLMANAKTL